MIWSELSREQQAIYEWFHSVGCGIWKDDSIQGQCPIVQEQLRYVNPVNLRFLPEAIWGDPANPIWFMGINPGQEKGTNPEPGGTIGPPADVAAEREACLNNISADQSLAQYCRRHDWVLTHQDAPDHYVFRDNVTKASLGLLTGQAQLVAPQNVGDDVFRKLTILNMAHCKCPSYTQLEKAAGFDPTLFWDRCGEMNLRALLSWRPKFVVMFGEPPQWWLLRVVQHAPVLGWNLNGVQLSRNARWWDLVATITGPTDYHAKVLFLRHVARRQLSLVDALPRFTQAAQDAGVMQWLNAVRHPA